MLAASFLFDNQDSLKNENSQETITNFEAPIEPSLNLPIGGDLHGKSLLDKILKSWTGDLDGIKERQVVRMLTTYSPTNYYIKRGVPTGMVVDAAREFEKQLNKNNTGRHINVVVMAAPEEQLFNWLKNGHGDIIASNITITEERADEFSFSQAFISNVNEQVVLSPNINADIKNLNDLAAADIEIMVRPNSSYSEHLKRINRARQAAGRKLLKYQLADNALHGEDILELVSNGVVDATIMDNHLLDLWRKVFTNLKIPEDLAIHRGGQKSWVVRQNNPQLLAFINNFVPSIQKGSRLGNIVINRYLKSRARAKKALEGLSAQHLKKTIASLQRHAETYKFDWLLLAAQGFQESRLDQGARSNQGAVGIMQVLPTTAKEPYINIDNIYTLDGNIEAGTKYNRWLIDTYFSDTDISIDDRILFGLASYNAGPGNLKKARRLAKKMHLDPNLWFNNVELAMEKHISQEPVIYVRNIYKYYAAYSLYIAALEAKQKK